METQFNALPAASLINHCVQLIRLKHTEKKLLNAILWEI